MLDVDYFSAHRALIEDQKSSPFELNLGWAVSADKGPFNGRRALRGREGARAGVGIRRARGRLGVARAALRRARAAAAAADASRGARACPSIADGKQVGYATSGCWSPLLKKYLALAHVEAPHFQPGTAVEIEVTVEHHRQARATPSCASSRSSIRERKKA